MNHIQTILSSIMFSRCYQWPDFTIYRVYENWVEFETKIDEANSCQCNL